MYIFHWLLLTVVLALCSALSAELSCMEGFVFVFICCVWRWGDCGSWGRAVAGVHIIHSMLRLLRLLLLLTRGWWLLRMMVMMLKKQINNYTNFIYIISSGELKNIIGVSFIISVWNINTNYACLIKEQIKRFSNIMQDFQMLRNIMVLYLQVKRGEEWG